VKPVNVPVVVAAVDRSIALERVPSDVADVRRGLRAMRATRRLLRRSTALQQNVQSKLRVPRLVTTYILLDQRHENPAGGSAFALRDLHETFPEISLFLAPVKRFPRHGSAEAE